MKKILSIIVPSYNVEKYLDKCVQSFVNSKYLDNIEVLIVNDGSKDSTEQIAKNWEKKFPNSIRLISKENGGHGSTINRGVKECVGKYFKVVDSDDWVDTGEFDLLVEKLFEIDVDCVVCDFNRVYEKSGVIKRVRRGSKFPAGKVLSYEKFIKKSALFMHALTYNTESYRKTNTILTEKCFFVDMQWIVFPLISFETVVCFPFNVYQYRLEREGQSVSRQGFLKHVEDHRKVMLSLCEFHKNFPNEKRAVKKVVRKTISDHVLSEFTYVLNPHATKEEIEKYKEYKNFIKKQYKPVYNAFRFNAWFMNVRIWPAYLRNRKNAGGGRVKA